LLQEQLKEYSKFGFGMAVLTLPLFTCKADNIPDSDEMFNEGSKAEKMSQLSVIKGNSLYHERMSGVIADMVDLGYI
jgi:hypothetical protein